MRSMASRGKIVRDWAHGKLESVVEEHVKTSWARRYLVSAVRRICPLESENHFGVRNEALNVARNREDVANLALLTFCV